jgi:hypothetical protein
VTHEVTREPTDETRIQAAKPARSRGLRSGTERCNGASVRSREGALRSHTLCHLSRGAEHVVIFGRARRSSSGDRTIQIRCGDRGVRGGFSSECPRGEDNAHGERRKSSKRVGRRETRDSSAKASRRIGRCNTRSFSERLVEAAVSRTQSWVLVMRTVR